MIAQIIISHYFESTGGVSTYVRELMRHSNHELGETLLLTPDAKTEGNGVIVLRARSRIRLFFETLRKLNQVRPRHIQVHGPWYFVAATAIHVRLRRLLTSDQATFFVVKHTEKFYSLHSPTLWAHRFLDGLSDGISFVSERFRMRYCEQYGYPSNKSFVSYPGLCSSAVELFEPNSLRPRGRYISYCGLFEYREKVEGLLRLLEAFAVVRDEIDGLDLVVIGRGKLRALVLEKIESLSLQNRVSLIEDCDDPRLVMQNSLLHCHISLQESFGLIVLEALAVGTPVLVNDFGDWGTLGIEGIHCCGNSVEDIAGSLRSVSGCHSTQAGLGLERVFDWNRTANLLGNMTS
jgi:glycosyltransferase involved in cell wall biosynthesis